MSDPYYGPGGDPTDSAGTDVTTLDTGGQVAIVKGSRDVWEAISAFVDARIKSAVADILETSSGLTNVAVTMGTPGVPLVANASPWAHVVIPFFAIIQRVQYYAVPAGGSFSVDVKIVRPGQATADASTFYPGAPPSFTADVSLATSSDWMGYVEPGACLLFYVTAASGVELVTANVIMRTIG